MKARMFKSKYNLTEGPILKLLVKLSIPIILANLLQTLYNFIDTFWLGRVGSEAIAAVSLSFPIIYLMIALEIGLSTAGTILLAQYVGKKNKKMVDYIATQTTVVMFLLALTVGVLGFFISPYIISAMHPSPNVFSNAIIYLQIMFIGFFLLAPFFLFQGFMRSIGDVKTPLFVALLSVILNFILDPIFIMGYGFVPQMGVKGAAISTLISYGFSSLVLLFKIRSKEYYIDLKMKYLRLNPKLIKKMFKLGFPASTEQSIRGFAMTFLSFVVAKFGTDVIAAFGIGVRVQSFVIIQGMGISMATSTIVGHNLGAKKIDRAKETAKKGMLLTTAYLTLLSFFLYWFAPQITRFFIPNNEAVVKITTEFIRVMAFGYPVLALHQTIRGVFRGAGMTAVSMSLSVINLLVLRVPVAYFLAMFTALGYKGVWITYPLSNIILFGIALIWYLTGSWQRKNITDKFSKIEKMLEDL